MLKNIFLFWLAISIVWFVITGGWPNAETYLNNLINRLPDWHILIEDIVQTVNMINGADVNTFREFLAVLAGGVVLIVQVLVVLPIKVIWFLLQTLYAFLPVGWTSAPVTL